MSRADEFTRSDLSVAQVTALREEIDRLNASINHPHIDSFLEGVRIEAAHQVERWGSEHDEGKTPLDWFWLIGYLSQKVVVALAQNDNEKARHHTISTAAALFNWFRAITGEDNRMRPGTRRTE